ncbi:MAG: phage baseplate assembly protein V [bacterium]
MNFIDTFHDSEVEKRKDRIYGVAVGIVTNNDDADGLGRVKVHFPWLSDENESAWARVAVVMAGNNRGAWFPPQIDDEVLVAFEHGDINKPIVIGAMWNGKDAPPSTDTESIVIQDKNGSFIKFEVSEGKITIEAKEKLEIKAGKSMKLEAGEIDIN